MSIFVQEPFGPPRSTDLRVGVITDGTTRGGPNGIAEGARRVVECAEHCAERDDVALLAAFVVSPQNAARRERSFFAALHAEFLRLAEAVASGRVLPGIRVETCGRLDRLVNRGGAAARLAHVIELLCEATEATVSTDRPRLRLVFCIDYDEDTPLALGLDALIRTGMEQPGVMRLSGLRVQPRTVCIADDKLWRKFSAAALDDAIARVVSHARHGFGSGFSPALIADLIAELSRAHLPRPLRITLPLAASAAETAALLDSAASGSSRSAHGVAVTAALPPMGALRRVGPKRARLHVQLVTPGLAASLGAPDAWLAPGLPTSVFHLQERSAGDANVHPCEPTPAGIVEGLWRAIQYHEAHPPLHGAPRPDARANRSEYVENLIDYLAFEPRSQAPVIARTPDERDRRDASLTATAFADRCVSEARAARLVSGEVDWERQAAGYAMTAFAIAVPRDPSRAGCDDSEPAARAVARVMLALASSDEEITDRVFPSECRGERRERVLASVEYLIARIHGEGGEPPAVRGVGVLRAIGRAWEDFFALVTPSADQALLQGVKQAAVALYRANVAELSRIDPRVRSLLRCPTPRTIDAVDRLYASLAPGPVARRMRELLQTLQTTRLESRRADEQIRRELRLLCRLSRVAPSIGAGCALLAMAATERGRAIPAGGATAFLRVIPLLDHYFRLANDLAFSDATRGDRDDKVTTFTCLIPSAVSGKEHERTCIEALQTCRNTAAWLEGEIESAVDEVSRLWQLGARWLRRGIHVGRGAYELGHYERLDPAAMADIIAEIEPPVAPRRPRSTSLSRFDP